MEAPNEPGIYEGVPFEEYCTWPFVNNSSLSWMRKSPAHYKSAQSQEWDTDALRFGRFLHDSTLEPSRIGQYYAVMPDLSTGIDSKKPWLTNEYKERKAEFEKVAAGKEIVSQEWYASTQVMLHRLYQHERSRSWLCDKGGAEVTIVWDEPTTGLRCKARCDKLASTGKVIADIKTSRDVTRFNKSVGDYRYHRQAAFYSDAMQAVSGEVWQFGFIAIEKSEPYAVRAALLDEDSISAGRREYRSLLATLKQCQDSGEWPGPDDPEAWTCPDWARERDEEELKITINGAEV